MKKLLVFSVSILCLSLALAIVLHQFGEFAVASSTAPMATEVITANGSVSAPVGSPTTVPWPLYPDGTQATVSECSGLVSQFFHFSTESVNWRVDHDPVGLTVQNFGDNLQANFYYLIVCTRSAGGPVAAQQSTWGEIKSLYGE